MAQQNKNIIYDIIQQHPEHEWEEIYINLNQNVTMDFIQEHPELKWNYSQLLSNPNITWDFILQHPELLKLVEMGHTRFFYSNRSITIDIVKKYNLCMESFILENPNFNFENPGINPEDYHYLLISNPRLSFSSIENYMNHYYPMYTKKQKKIYRPYEEHDDYVWVICRIIMNPFTGEKNKFIREKCMKTNLLCLMTL